MSGIQKIFTACGNGIARIWLALLGLCIMFAFPASGLIASVYVGFLAFDLVGRGNIGVATLAVTALGFGVFLAAYVWEPHVKPVVSNIVETLLKDIKS